MDDHPCHPWCFISLERRSLEARIFDQSSGSFLVDFKGLELSISRAWSCLATVFRMPYTLVMLTDRSRRSGGRKSGPSAIRAGPHALHGSSLKAAPIKRAS